MVCMMDSLKFVLACEALGDDTTGPRDGVAAVVPPVDPAVRFAWTATTEVRIFGIRTIHVTGLATDRALRGTNCSSEGRAAR
jgi:hypothetical protein